MNTADDTPISAKLKKILIKAPSLSGALAAVGGVVSSSSGGGSSGGNGGAAATETDTGGGGGGGLGLVAGAGAVVSGSGSNGGGSTGTVMAAPTTPTNAATPATVNTESVIGDEDPVENSREMKENGLSWKQRYQLKHRELFLSRQVETLPATHIRGKCSVTLLNETESLLSYLNKDVCVFFNNAVVPKVVN